MYLRRLPRWIPTVVACERGGGFDGRVMDVDDVAHLRRIATRHADGHRQSVPAAMIEDHLVALAQSVLAQIEESQSIAGERVGTGQINRRIGPCL